MLKTVNGEKIEQEKDCHNCQYGNYPPGCPPCDDCINGVIDGFEPIKEDL